MLHAAGIVALLFVVGSLMVSTVRFPSSKQKMSAGLIVALLINVGLLVWLKASYFVLFFLVYIVGTLALNLAWRTGWTGIAPPVIYQDEDVL